MGGSATTEAATTTTTTVLLASKAESKVAFPLIKDLLSLACLLRFRMLSRMVSRKAFEIWLSGGVTLGCLFSCWQGGLVSCRELCLTNASFVLHCAPFATLPFSVLGVCCVTCLACVQCMREGIVFGNGSTHGTLRFLLKLRGHIS